jgi:hypothetical protein
MLPRFIRNLASGWKASTSNHAEANRGESNRVVPRRDALLRGVVRLQRQNQRAEPLSARDSSCPA